MEGGMGGGGGALPSLVVSNVAAAPTKLLDLDPDFCFKNLGSGYKVPFISIAIGILALH